MEEYSGAYMRLLHNVFRVDRANLVLASDTPTTPVQADRDVTRNSPRACSTGNSDPQNYCRIEIAKGAIQPRITSPNTNLYRRGATPYRSLDIRIVLLTSPGP